MALLTMSSTSLKLNTNFPPIQSIKLTYESHCASRKLLFSFNCQAYQHYIAVSGPFSGSCCTSLSYLYIYFISSFISIQISVILGLKLSLLYTFVQKHQNGVISETVITSYLNTEQVRYLRINARKVIRLKWKPRVPLILHNIITSV